MFNTESPSYFFIRAHGKGRFEPGDRWVSFHQWPFASGDTPGGIIDHVKGQLMIMPTLNFAKLGNHLLSLHACVHVD